MIHYKDLTKLFVRSLQINKANKKGGRLIFRFLVFFCILFIFLPFLAIITAFVYEMMLKLNDASFASVGYEVLISLVTVFIFVFSFNVLLNELFFSEDIENLLPLPVKPSVMVASKFSSCFLVENLILFIVLLFACWAYIIAVGVPGTNLLLSVLGIILIPMAPMAYCVIISLIFMYLFRNIANKKNVKKLGFVFLGLLIVAVIFLLFKLSTFDFELYVETFAEGDHKFLDIMNILFPSIHYFVDGLNSGSIVSILISIVINAITFVVMLLFAEPLYYPAVSAFVSHDTTSKKMSLNMIKNYNIKKPVMSYFIKDIKFLFRSPTFFINCMLINLIWPIFLFLIFKLGFPSYTITHMRELISTGDTSILTVLFFCHIGVSIILPAFNSLASSSFSREGKNYLFIKYIPMRYGVQWKIKYAISLILSYFFANVYMIPFYIVIHFPITYSLLFLGFSLLCVLLVSYIGILIDSLYPKIIWDDEADALRENYNAFIAMGFSLLFFGLLCGGGYYLSNNYQTPFSSLVILAFIILAISDCVLYLVSNLCVSNFIRNQEV